ncbi:MAG TPA: lysophospholipid acyltransferase family protein [Nitrospiria bacterium]|jgi:1-acyl-sn-glycerol-3-phosphate acyltransferase|nr:lysophospholipid acyltransferase family protein [Nitrospiria bacterium]
MLYAVSHAIVKTMGRLLLRLRVVGAEHVPQTGPVLFAPNHVSYLDIPLLGAMIDRPLHFMGKSSLFRGRFVGRLYRKLNGFPIEKGHRSRIGLMEAVRRLKQGHCVVMYPEGGRSIGGRLQKPMPGIGMIVAKSGAKVIPVYVAGTDKALPVGAWMVRLHPVTVFIGEPIDFTEQIRKGDGKELYLQISRTVMEQIVKLEAQAMGEPIPKIDSVPDATVKGENN